MHHIEHDIIGNGIIDEDMEVEGEEKNGVRQSIIITKNQIKKCESELQEKNAKKGIKNKREIQDIADITKNLDLLSKKLIDQQRLLEN